MKGKLFLISAVLGLLSVALISSSCGTAATTAAPPPSGALTYATTSAIGDYAKWTIDTTVSPASFSVVWNVIDTSGDVTKTMNISGTCSSENATYHYRTCTVSASDDANVQVGGVFHILEVPGVALLVHPAGVESRGSGTGADEIHVGFSLGSCSNSSGAGDYVFTRVLPVSNPWETEMVGMYRITPEFINANFNGDLTHSGFAIQEVGPSFQVIYNLAGPEPGSNDQGSFSGIDTFTGSCSGGTIQLQQAGNDSHLRGVVTSSGLMFFDGPQDFGGLVSAKTDVAATIDDLAGKTIVVLWQNSGIGGCASEQGCTDLIRVTFGAKDVTGMVPASLTAMSGMVIGDMGFRAASDPEAVPRFSSVNTGYSNNSLSLTYPQPADIPGLFYSDEMQNGNETPTMLVVAKINGKLLVFGNNSTRESPGGCLNGAATCDRASGNFVGFEP